MRDERGLSDVHTMEKLNWGVVFKVAGEDEGMQESGSLLTTLCTQ